jgi:GT2 family glycosyltransferase
LAQDDDPLISILTVNWNGKRYLDDLFNSIFSLNYPMEKLQVLMVDNNSSDDSVKYVKENFPAVEILELDENRGYAGGNNEGFKKAKGKYIALINNDCVADPNWLGEMLSIFNRSKDEAKIGAVGPKVVFYWYYLPLQIISESQNLTVKDKGSRKPRRLGVRLSLVEASSSPGIKAKTSKSVKAKPGCSEDIEPNIRYLEGFYPQETGSSGEAVYWTQGNAVMAVPIADISSDTILEFIISSEISANNLKIVLGEEILEEKKIGKRPVKIKIKITSDHYKYRKDIINSCGAKINRSFYSRDRGYLSFDDGQYCRVEEIFALSGSSFMVDRKMLDDVGYFDPDFFTYYEDIDLFWRARLKGWKHFFTPNALIRHHHCGSGQEWSYDFTYHVLRNRLLMIYKNGWLLIFIRSQAAFIVSKAIHTLYYISQLARGSKVKRMDIPIRFRVFFEMFYLLPKYLKKRLDIRLSSKIRDMQIKTWLRDFK